MKHSALFAALFGLMAVSPPVAGRSIGQGRGGNRKTPRSRTPGKPQPAGSKLSRMAAEHRVGGRTTL
jgi:hypothetical protein